MNNSTGILTASIILGGSVIISTLISKGIILEKQPEQPHENIVTTTVGHTNLGKVYSERRSLDISINNPNDETNGMLLDLKDLDPNEVDEKLTEKLKSIADSLNKENTSTDKNKVTAENISAKVPLQVKIRTHVDYRSEFTPHYDLTILEESFDLPIQQGVKAFALSKATGVIAQSQVDFEKSMFIKTP